MNEPKTSNHNKNLENITHLDQTILNWQTEFLRYALYERESDTKQALVDRLNTIDSFEDMSQEGYDQLVAWLLLIQPSMAGSLILQSFIEEYEEKDPQLCELAENWKEAFPLIGTVEQVEGSLIWVQDHFQYEQRAVKVIGDIDLPEANDVVMEIVVPYGEEATFFRTYFSDEWRFKELFLKNARDWYEDTDMEAEEFLMEYYPELLEAFVSNKWKFGVDAMSWGMEGHREGARLLYHYLYETESPDHVTQLGILLWRRYCKNKEPRIQNPAIYAASIEYFVRKLMDSSLGSSQQDVAGKYGVKGKDISRTLQKIDETIEEEMIHLFKDVTLAGELTFDQLGFYDHLDIHTGGAFDVDDPILDPLYDALDAEDNEEREKHIEEATQLTYKPSDVYLFMAHQQEEIGDQVDYFKRALHVEEELLNSRGHLQTRKKNLWSIRKVRPFMEIKLTYANALMRQGDVTSAISHFEELLGWNPKDHQGVRYHVFKAYMKAGLYDQADAILEREDHSSPFYACSRALVEYKWHGFSDLFEEWIQKIEEENSLVLSCLIGEKDIPNQINLHALTKGKTQAMGVARFQKELWEDEEELMEWLRMKEQG